MLEGNTMLALIGKDTHYTHTHQYPHTRTHTSTPTHHHWEQWSEMVKFNGDKISSFNMHQLPFGWPHHTTWPLLLCPFHHFLLYSHNLWCLLGGFYVDKVKSRSECASGVQWAWWLCKQENGWTHHSPHGHQQGSWPALMVLLTAMSYGSVTNELPKWEHTTSQPNNLVLTKKAINEIHSLSWLQWEVDGWLGWSRAENRYSRLHHHVKVAKWEHGR